MKFISFTRGGQAGFGAVLGEDQVVDLTGKVQGAQSLKEVLARGLEEEAKQLANASQPDCKLSDVTLLPVIPNPNKVICVGINYVAHAAEAGRKVGDYPVIFQRFADSLAAHEQPLLVPKVSEQFDYECELAVVIGRGGGHIDEADAMSHVAGYTCFNDASVRDWQFHTHQYGMGKNFRATGALGPWMVSADEVADYRELEVMTLLNGEKLQHGKLDQLAFDIPKLISYVSKAVDWQPGDILATGTPSGIGFKRNPPIFLKPGDVCEVVIPGIGTLRNPIEAEK